MKAGKIIENSIGVLSLVIILYLAYDFGMKYRQHSGSSPNDYNSYFAIFNDIDGINVGSDVKLAGWKVGKVKAVEIDKRYKVKLAFDMNRQYTIPKDSTMIIATSGLLGAKYLRISPGGESEALAPGGEINNTQSSINFESLLGLFKK